MIRETASPTELALRRNAMWFNLLNSLRTEPSMREERLSHSLRTWSPRMMTPISLKRLLSNAPSSASASAAAAERTSASRHGARRCSPMLSKLLCSGRSSRSSKLCSSSASASSLETTKSAGPKSSSSHVVGIIAKASCRIARSAITVHSSERERSSEMHMSATPLISGKSEANASVTTAQSLSVYSCAHWTVLAATRKRLFVGSAGPAAPSRCESTGKTISRMMSTRWLRSGTTTKVACAVRTERWKVLTITKKLSKSSESVSPSVESVPSLAVAERTAAVMYATSACK
mmetsp:Transcript_34772/g.86496  ORF Transcript_34772/g.86496 Transcript_34772/m.86496 type:complete len:290 (+) Transcript_34772:343-1212(+)